MRYSLEKSDVDAYVLDLETHGFLRMNSTGKIELIIGDGMDWRPNGSLWNAYYHRWIQEVTSYMALKDTPDKYTSVEISQRKFTKAVGRIDLFF